MSKDEAQKLAIDRAIETLRDIDIIKRLDMHGFNVTDSRAPIRIFGQDASFDTETFALSVNETPAKPGDQILLLHYLLCDLPVTETSKQISFRELSGGQFYWAPFQSRTVSPLVKKIGNDLEMLKTNLNKFDWEQLPQGDFTAKIHALGNLYITLVWHQGDDEFPPAADLIFDSCLKRVFEAEDTVVMASRICIGCLF